jgi:hypothetical protein
MLLGFSSQLKVVWYPSSWEETDKMLEQDPECKALFLPWHQYYVVKFNNGRLTANPAKSFFNCEIVSGENMEIGNIKTQEGHSPEYYELEAIVTSNKLDPNEGVKYLKDHGFRYVIFSSDQIEQDEFSYPFLSSPQLQKVTNNEELYLFKIL